VIVIHPYPESINTLKKWLDENLGANIQLAPISYFVNAKLMKHDRYRQRKLIYRKCVGVMLLNAQGHVFVGQRIDNKADAWQMPQGGVNEGEDIEVAARRELEEEIGTSNIEIIAQAGSWYSYDIRIFSYRNSGAENIAARRKCGSSRNSAAMIPR